jgi:ubiquinone/menaquinone biosynthesis C-methylase UbiE
VACVGAPFDHIATNYDSLFTNSAIGQLQRAHVWKYLERVTPELRGLDMLELNCGTGEDALLFSDRGFNIVATDISEEMLKVTQQKVQQFSMQHRISSQFLDLESFDETSFNKRFDLIFSNFGGLNCINPESLKTLLTKIPLALNPGGRFIGVIMPRFCLWESFYFLLKFSPARAFRRYTDDEVIANLNGAEVPTWYYSPSQIISWSKKHFDHVRSKAVGIALPPSYLENFFSRRKTWLSRLNQMESRLGSLSSLASYSDHFLIDLRLK